MIQPKALALILLFPLTACIDLPDIDDLPPEEGPSETNDSRPDAGTPSDSSDSQPDASTPADSSSNPDAGTSSENSVPDAGPQEPLQVQWVLPAEKVYTKDAVAVRVEVTGGTPDSVELFVGEVQVATLTTPYTSNWNTATMPEGTYHLTARARRGDESFTSDSRTVVVDRTPPRVVWRSPEPGASNVPVRQELRAVFSEPLMRDSVTESSVHVLVNAVDRAKTLALAEDGQSVRVVPAAEPVAEDAVTVEFNSSITDLAGNALEKPTVAWSWGLPAFVPLNAPLTSNPGKPNVFAHSMQLDASGNPVVAWSENDGTAWVVHVRRWNGTGWNPLGEPIHIAEKSGGVGYICLRLDASGRPFLAWNAIGDEAADVQVRRWNGSAWELLGGSLSANPGYSNAGRPAMRLDASGQPVVAWSEPDGRFYGIYVRRWDGSAWNPVGGMVSAANQVDTYVDDRAPGLVLDPKWGTIVSWAQQYSNYTFVKNIYAKWWTGFSWEPLGAALSANAGDTSAEEPVLQMDASGRAVVAWRESDESGGVNVYVRRFVNGDWIPFGGALNANSGETPTYSPSLMLTQTGEPVVAWQESNGEAGNIYVGRWGGGTWTLMGGALSANPGQTPARLDDGLQVDSAGCPMVSWSESDLEGRRRLYVVRCNR